MDSLSPPSDEQARLWNGVAGQAWVDNQDLLDETFEPFKELLVDEIAAAGVRRPLDVGCGTGTTTLAAAARIGAPGRCVGIDISEPMIAVARARAARGGASARFICANAEDHRFEPGSVDLVMSRFGVMFFDDPVRAFTNLRHAATADAPLCMIAWRSPAENPFMTTAERAAAPLMPELPPRRPNAPGQFAFADKGRVEGILQQSGWRDIDLQPLDVDCSFPASGLERYFTRLGPLGMALQESDEPARARIIDVVRAAFDPFVHDDEVRFTAACWMIRARA